MGSWCAHPESWCPCDLIHPLRRLGWLLTLRCHRCGSFEHARRCDEGAVTLPEARAVRLPPDRVTDPQPCRHGTPGRHHCIDCEWEFSV